LAYVYDKGDGAPVSQAKAFKWFLAATSNGLRRAMFDQSSRYDHGEVVAKDLTEAIYLVFMATAKGRLIAMFNLWSSR
jgi:TPR repeat protein